MSVFDEKMKAAELALRERRGVTKQPKSAKALRNGSGQADMREVETRLEAFATKTFVEGVASKVRADLNALLNTLPEFQNRKVLEVVTSLGEKVGEIKGLRHNMFEDLVRAATVVNSRGDRKNIMLKGPMGSGKSTAGKQLADLFNLPFHYLGQTEMPHNVVGHVHPTTNEFMHTPFTRAFINGGVVMLEEMDSWSPRATLVANVPLANGYITLDDGSQHERHKDCIIIACTNTWGTGATTEYVGRNKLDAAFLDRFAIKLDWIYDVSLERIAADNDAVVDVVQAARFNAEHYGVKVTISPRSSIDISDMVKAGFDMRQALNLNFLSSCDKAQRKMLLEGVDL